MAKFYHGTSADNLESILENGFDGSKGEAIWSVSNNANYFWSPSLMLEKGETDQLSDALDIAKRNAFESAECGMAKAKDCRRVVFEIEAPEDLFEQDLSCENMDFAVVSVKTISPSRISRYWIDSEDMSYFKPYFGSIMMDRNLAVEIEFSNVEKVMIEALQKSENALCIIAETLCDLQCEAKEISL